MADYKSIEKAIKDKKPIPKEVIKTNKPGNSSTHPSLIQESGNDTKQH